MKVLIRVLSVSAIFEEKSISDRSWLTRTYFRRKINNY
jgi:hypothetical protein